MYATHFVVLYYFNNFSISHRQNRGPQWCTEINCMVGTYNTFTKAYKILCYLHKSASVAHYMIVNTKRGHHPPMGMGKSGWGQIVKDLDA